MREGVKPGYIHVTDILAPLNKYPVSAHAARDAAGARGTRIHEAIAAHQEGVFYPLGDERPYFESFLKWVEVCPDYRLVSGSSRLYDEKLKITGEFDALLQGPNGLPSIVDWKTTAILNKEYCELQGNFYCHLATLNGLAIADDFIFVHLKPSGKAASAVWFKRSHVSWNQCLKYYHQHLSTLTIA